MGYSYRMRSPCHPYEPLPVRDGTLERAQAGALTQEGARLLFEPTPGEASLGGASFGSPCQFPMVGIITLR